MPRINPISGTDLVKLLLAYDSTIKVRKGASGSHLVQMTRIIDGKPKNATIAFHGNKPLKLGTLKGILRKLGIPDSILRK